MKNKIYGYTLLRSIMGINLLVHGLVRIPKLEAFNTWIVGHFSETILPEFLVSGFGYVIPFAELTLGALILLGLFSEKAILASMFLMLNLVFGSCLTESWEWATFQMIYAIFLYILLTEIERNKISVDSKFIKDLRL